jgi:hypothetical protein
MINGELVGQLFRVDGRRRFVLAGRGLLLAGDVRFWDDVPLAGNFQRVFFGNTYWGHQAVQLETAYRVNLWWNWLDLFVGFGFAPVGFDHTFSLNLQTIF